jgi:hypothetical protein
MGAQKNFSIFMSEFPELFPSSWMPDREFYRRCISQAILFRACERVVRARKFTAYRANIVVYTYALVAHVAKGEIDLGYVWTEQDVSQDLECMLDEWAEKVDIAIRKSAGSRNVTEWCKKTECWDAVRSLPLAIPDPEPAEFLAKANTELPAELGSSAVAPTRAGMPLNAGDDEVAIEECMRHDAATWAKLNFWGVSTSTLDYYERGVAHTLSEYANSEWTKKPSAKQARIGVRVLRRAREAKLL